MHNVATNMDLPTLYRQRGAIGRRLMIIIFIVFALIAGAWLFVSLSFNSDVKIIGQGKPAIVMIFSYGDSNSTNLKYGYKKLRGEYKDTVEFVLVNIHSPNGLRFLQHTKVKAGTALYYDGKGELLLTLTGPKDVAALSESIKTTFGI